MRARNGWLKVIGKTIAIAGVAIAGGVTLLAIGALMPRRWSFPEHYSCEFKLYIVSDGFHTNFFVPIETPMFNWRTQFDLDQIANRSSQAYRYLQFGWGDRIFYIETPSWEQVRLTNALRALFYWQNQAAIFVKGHPALPQLPHEQMQCVKLSAADYLALMQFIQNTFEPGDRGQLQRLASGQDQASGFFVANGNYSILNTCNTWTATGLRAANVNTPLWDGLATPIMWHLRNGCQCEVGGEG